MVDRSKLQALFRKVAAAAGQPTSLRVVRSRQRNAWTDGTCVWVTTALVSELGERELAAVLGHELGHIVERHLPTTRAARRQLREQLYRRVSGDWLAMLAASAVVESALGLATAERRRQLEHRADLRGESYANRAGYARGSMSDALERVAGGRPSGPTHPSTETRRKALRRGGRKLRVRVKRKIKKRR